MLGAAFVWACGFDISLREYLSANFWMPFAKHGAAFEKRNVRRISAPFAGMVAAKADTPLQKLRKMYQPFSNPEGQANDVSFDPAAYADAIAAARADRSLSGREREEVELIDAKIDVRAHNWESARAKLDVFLRSARTSEFRSEARGWLAHVHFSTGNQTAAGKIYLDELNRNGSNLSRETMLNSLRMTYGYDGGPKLVADLEQYFDTPEHAAFAIQLATNPHWSAGHGPWDRERFQRAEWQAQAYRRIRALFQMHHELLASEPVALLGMRTALRMGDPREVVAIAQSAPPGARRDPDFLWMLASAHFLTHEYAAAEQPLLDLFASPRTSEDQKCAAAYGLCGVYRKLGRRQEQIRFALWLYNFVRKRGLYLSNAAGIHDLSVYWASSGWDLNLLLDSEASIEDLRTFAEQNPTVEDVRLVWYALAVRLARENRYGEAAPIYESIHALRRAPRMRQLDALYQAAQTPQGKYEFAAFVAAHPDGIYFNDSLWHGLQRYAMQGSTEYRLTKTEREAQIAAERKLKDDQEERWRAYLILRDVVRQAGHLGVGRKAAVLALRCIRGINTDRFGHAAEVRKGDFELTAWLRG